MTNCFYDVQGQYLCKNVIENFYAGGFFDGAGASKKIPDGTINGCQNCNYERCTNNKNCIIKCAKCVNKAGLTLKDCPTSAKNCGPKTAIPASCIKNNTISTCPDNHLQYADGNQIYHVPCDRSLYYEKQDPQWQSQALKVAQKNCTSPLDNNYAAALNNVYQEYQS